MKLPLEPEFRTFKLPLFKSIIKRLFDLIFVSILLPFVLPISLVLVLFAKMFNGKGLFIQSRIGRYGECFDLYKICSMKQIDGHTTNITTTNDPRITTFGHIIRRTKLDELPQILNVLKGDMSFVGPRPDVPEAYIGLQVEDADFICIRPGITGLAALEFKNEESLLASVNNPEEYYSDFIFPKKVKLNNLYLEKQSLKLDLKIMVQTIAKIFI